jgi:predicted ATP-grasp superfamily ATP-dependent carboligase
MLFCSFAAKGSKMKILLLDGETNAAVACVRSLGKAGHEVTVGSAIQSPWCKAARSRFASASFGYPDPRLKPEQFVRAIVTQIERSRQRPILVLPAAEASMLVLSGARESICAAGALMVVPPLPELVRACNKQEMTALASSLGIRTPRTVCIQQPPLAAEMAQGLQYPVVLKCHSSEQILPDGRLAMTPKQRYARNPAEFLEACQGFSRSCFPVLAQEFIQGEGVGYFALTRHGELRAEFAHRRIREVCPTGSQSTLRMGIAVPGRVRDAGQRLLREIKWHGVAMVEFRVQPDGTPVFLEVNPRFWGSLALAVYSGVDFPALFAAMAEHGDVPPQFHYRENVRCRWLLGDFIHLCRVWDGAPAGYPGVYPSRLGTLLKLLVPVPGTRHDSFTLDDPLPEVADWMAFGVRSWRKLVAKDAMNSSVRDSSPLAEIARKAGQPS